MKYAADIVQVMINKFLSLNQTITNFNIGSRIRSLFESIGLGIEEIWFRIDTMYQGLFAVTAKEDDLDDRAMELGIQRKGPQKSSGYVRFYGAANTEIPLETIASTDPDIEPIVEFVSTEKKYIAATGHVDVPFEAKEAGKQGNVEAEKVVYLPQSIAGVSEIKNIDAIAGGDDTEDDDTLRKRNVLRWYTMSFGGCEESFRSWAMEVVGVADAQAIVCWAGSGTVKIIVWGKDEDEKLIPGSDTLIENVQSYIDARRPICSGITVAKPTGILVNVFISLVVEDGYTFSVVAENVKNAVTNFFDSLGIGEDLLLSKLLVGVMEVEGVEDAQILYPKANVECGVGETIMLGQCYVNPKGWEQEYVVW
jgi:uncharacterized phage protein gp47/JayE